MLSKTQLEKVKKLHSLLIIHYFHINFLLLKEKMTFLKTLSHESNRNNEILKCALHFVEVHFCNSK